MAWRTEDIPDQSGKVAVVTGGNGGLGLETAKALAGSVAVATGRVGSRVVELLEVSGHDVVPMSRSTGVDVVTGEVLRRR